MYISPYGKPEGLADRLEKFASQLGKDRGFPWIGTGIIDDLRCAAAMIEGKPIPLTDEQQEEAEQKALNLEWDL